MEALGSYILSIVAGSMILGILHTLLEKKSSSATLLRLIGGLFLAFIVLVPIADINFDSAIDTRWDFAAQGQAISEQGQELSQTQFHNIIKQQCEAYILDKALSYQTSLDVNVVLSQDELPVPVMVHMQGNISPYAKGVLQNWLNDEMGIPKENQIWSG